MPPRFAWGDSDLWIPEKPSQADTTPTLGFNRYWFFLGHLKPGVTEREAQADLTVVAQHLSTVYPKDYPKHFTVEIHSLTELVVGRFRTTLYHCARSSWVASAHRVRQRGQLAVGTSNDTGERVRNPRGARTPDVGGWCGNCSSRA